jgi:hypothetical protein
MNKREIIEKLEDVSENLEDIKEALEEINEEEQFDYTTSYKLSDINDLVFKLTHEIDKIVYQGK